MSCPSPLTHSMYADAELSALEAAQLERHAATCAACTARIATLRRESAVLRFALRQDEDAAPIPRFVPPPRARDFAVLGLAVLLIGGFSTAFWNTITAAIPSELKWLSPLESRTLFESAIDLMSFIVYEGPAMWTAALNFLGTALVLAFVSWLAFSAARHRAFAGMAAAVLAVVVALPSIGHAFEIRRNQMGDVTVAANETINDTLLAMGQTVTIDGTVTGDLLAFGREVTVRGNVTGNLVTAAQTVTIEGTVGGSVLGAAEDVSLANGRVGRDFFGFGNDVTINAGANVTGNTIAGGETVNVDGRVGIDFRGFGSIVSVSGAVEGDVEAHAGTMTVQPTARVGGNVTGHVDSDGDLSIAPGAVVGGNVDEQIVEREHRRNRYGRAGYYFGQVVRVGAMFLVGLLLFWVFPVLRDVSLPNVLAVLRSGAIGLAAAVTLPVAAVLVCITIVGIPIGILTFVLGAIGLYLSKIVISQIIGRALFRGPQGPPHHAMTLITGLAIVILVINLPAIGGIANFILTLVGFGIIVSLLFARFNREPA
jgi:anti-sigma factor RsiW/cytoskeletal protein CcmA (bactofilin family)